MTRLEADRIASRLLGEGANAFSLVGELWMQHDEDTFYLEVEEGSQGCPLLGAQGCRVHDIKPTQCSTYPFWPEILETRKTWKDEKPWCEGMNPQGKLYTSADILALLRDEGRTED